MNSQNQRSRVIKRASALIKSGLAGPDAYKQAWDEIKRHDDSTKQVSSQYPKASEKRQTYNATKSHPAEFIDKIKAKHPVENANKEVKTEYSSAWEKGDREATRFFVYILKLDGGTFYVGHTRDLRPRLFEHKNGTDSPIKHLNPKLQYFEILSDRPAARIRESDLKRIRDSNPRTIIQMIIDFQDLTEKLNYD